MKRVKLKMWQNTRSKSNNDNKVSLWIEFVTASLVDSSEAHVSPENTAKKKKKKKKSQLQSF